MSTGWRKRQITDKELELHVQDLAGKAGFIQWGEEVWSPGKGKIDWSCDYDKELIKFYQMVREEAIAECHPFQTDY
jgi:hypothetical protein